MARRYAGATVAVRGLNQLIRDFNKISGELRAEVQREIQAIAEVVKDEAVFRVVQDDLYDSGRLKSGIRARVRGGTGIVESRATKKGYRYPGIYEFGVSGRTKRKRPFLIPALEAKQGEVFEMLSDMLDRLTSEHGLGRGGRL